MRRKRLRTTTEIVGFVKDWEIIADNLSKAVSSWGYVLAIDSNRRTIWIADAHRNDGGDCPCFRSGEIRVLESQRERRARSSFDDANRKL